MVAQIHLGDVAVDVVRKDIKNVHLSVHPPTGRVTISAPSRMKPDAIRVFAVSQLAWIRRQQRKLQEQERETPREYLDREGHYVWGTRHLLKVMEQESAPMVEIRHKALILQVRPGSDGLRRQEILDEWYREQLKAAVPPVIAKWEPMLGVKVARFYVQRMKTRWGSCRPGVRGIRLNSELAKKPRECLEYIVVHEMVHLIEPTHNGRFVALMDNFMPKWRLLAESLNRLPVRHEQWRY